MKMARKLANFILKTFPTDTSSGSETKINPQSNVSYDSSTNLIDSVLT